VEPSVDGIWTPSDNGELVLVTGAGQVVDVKRGRVLRAWPASSPTEARLSEVRWAESNTVLRCEFYNGTRREFVYSTASTTLVPTADDNSNPFGALYALLDDPLHNKDYLWAYLFMLSAMKMKARGLSATSTALRYTVNDAEPRTANQITQATSFLIGIDLYSPRDVYNVNKRSRFYMLGDPMFAAGLHDMALMSCNGTNAPCVLDVPLCYDPLMSNPYVVGGAKTDTMYAEMVKAAQSARNWSEVPTRANLKRACTPAAASQVLTHPVTGALWIVREGQVFEIGRRGTQVRVGNGQCVPSYSARACKAGHWSATGAACTDCLLPSANNQSVAWQQQCAGAAYARRRLLSGVAASPKIELVLACDGTWTVGDAAAKLRQAANAASSSCMETEVGGGWRKAYLCVLTLDPETDPSAALRALRALRVTGVRDYLAPPTLVWSRTAASANDQNDDDALNVGVIVGATVAGVVGVVLVVGLFLWVLRRRPAANYQAVATKGPQ
jgi:hypothetical protein